LGIQRRLIGNQAGYLGKWWPAHDRIGAENAYLYGKNGNSIVAVTQKRWRFDLSRI
jgi:hypothetical protein